MCITAVPFWLPELFTAHEGFAITRILLLANFGVMDTEKPVVTGVAEAVLVKPVEVP